METCSALAWQSVFRAGLQGRLGPLEATRRTFAGGLVRSGFGRDTTGLTRRTPASRKIKPMEKEIGVARADWGPGRFSERSAPARARSPSGTRGDPDAPEVRVPCQPRSTAGRCRHCRRCGRRGRGPSGGAGRRSRARRSSLVSPPRLEGGGRVGLGLHAAPGADRQRSR